MSEPPGWLLARLPGSQFLVSRSSVALEVNYRHGHGELLMHLGHFRLVQMTSPGPGTPALLQALRDGGTPELAAIADLIEARRQEYDDLVESERVMQSLAGLSLP